MRGAPCLMRLDGDETAENATGIFLYRPRPSTLAKMQLAADRRLPPQVPPAATRLALLLGTRRRRLCRRCLPYLFPHLQCQAGCLSAAEQCAAAAVGAGVAAMGMARRRGGATPLPW